VLAKRIIPVLLLSKKGLVKSVNFKDRRYVGDPINAVKIFNEKEVDEIILLDIEASKNNTPPNLEVISKIGSEAFIPFGYGGGITTLSQVKQIMFSGAEKVILNHIALMKHHFVKNVAEHIGSSSTVVSIDVKKNFWGKYKVYQHMNGRVLEKDPIEHAQEMESLGAGELFINSVDLDGTMKGYDLKLMEMICSKVSVPVVACGGAGKLADIKNLFNSCNADSAAGSLFVFHGKHKAVLINYPGKEDLEFINE
jgi:cyclase